jgi:predicted alpha/beta superfamily hydrolase
MKRIIVCIVLLGFYSIFAQTQANLTVIVSSPDLEDTSKVFITGNQIEFGGWHPDKVPLDKENGLWKTTFSFEVGTILEFKFTKGSWLNEALDSNGFIPQNYSFSINSDTTVKYTINNWRNGEEEEVNYPGQITGEVRYHESMTYPGLLPRDVIVWLPPGYSENEDERYQVLYMHDGQNIVDPATNTVTHVDWQVDETLDSLIRKDEIDPTIVVGIYNTSNRRPEYSPTDTGYTYMKFVVEKLKPFIDSTYRTKPEREYTAIAGSSMGGIISFMFLWHYNDVFSKAICMSPAFKVVEPTRSINVNYVDDVINYNGPRKNIRVYIDNGGVGIEQIIQPGIEEMITALESKGYKKGVDYIFMLDKKAVHTESAWAERLPDAIKFIYGIN